MKYIKTYEKLIQHKPKFEIGQTVICIDDSYTKMLNINKKYIIEDIIKRLFSQKIDDEIIEDEYYIYKIEGISSRNFDETRFISEHEYMAKKYNIV